MLLVKMTRNQTAGFVFQQRFCSIFHKNCRKIFLVFQICLFQCLTDPFHKESPAGTGKKPENESRNPVTGNDTQCTVSPIKKIDLIPVKKNHFSIPDMICRSTGKIFPVPSDNKKFMIPLNKINRKLFLIFPAPVKETAVTLRLITRYGDP